MAQDWSRLLGRWIDAGVLDEETAARIRAFELTHAGSARLRWPVLVALAFGALMLGAGVLLFVSADWDALSPQARFALVLLLVASFHLVAALTADRFPAMATTLHAVGTVTLGAGIFLAGQIFNLEEHWPSGFMLWALGAGIGWAVLGHSPQMALVAILIPAWLSSEWLVATQGTLYLNSARIIASGLFLLALTYFTAVGAERTDPWRRTLRWVGGITLLPSALSLVGASGTGLFQAPGQVPPSVGLQTFGWTVALGFPAVLAVALRRAAAWPNALAALWVVALVNLRSIAGGATPYVWWALGAMGLVAWGVRESRRERINVGSAIFASTILAFYFSQVMDKLGRSASLVGLGLLFLAGGLALERIRRRLVLQVRGGHA